MWRQLCLTCLCGWGERYVRVEEYVLDVRFERMSVLCAVGLLGVNA